MHLQILFRKIICSYLEDKNRSFEYSFGAGLVENILVLLDIFHFKKNVHIDLTVVLTLLSPDPLTSTAAESPPCLIPHNMSVGSVVLFVPTLVLSFPSAFPRHCLFLVLSGGSPS